jgi:hypothetical protein
MVDEAQVKSEFNKQSGAQEENDAAATAAEWEPRKFEDGDVTREFNAEVDKEATASDASDDGDSSQTDGSSDSAAAGSADDASAGAQWEPPDYMKDTYRTEEDNDNDAAHRGGHGFTPGP